MISLLSLCFLIMILGVAYTWPLAGIGLTFLFSTVEKLYLPIFIGSHSISNLACPWLLIGILLHKDMRDKLIQSPFGWIAGLIALAEAISIPLSIHPLAALWSATHIWAYLLITLLITVNIRSLSTIRQALFLLYSTVILSALLSFYQILTRPGQGSFHATGGFLDWNYFPVYLMTLLPFITIEIKLASTLVFKRLYMGFFALVILLALAAASRTGMVIIALTLALLFFFHLVDRKYLKWLIPVIILAFYQLIQILGHQSLSLSEKISQWLSSPRLQDRFFTNLYGIQTLIRHPFLGVGSGQLESYVQWESALAAAKVQSSYTTLPVIFAELGLFGGLAYLALGTHMVSLFNQTTKTESYLKKAAYCSFCSLCISSFFFAIHTKLFTWCILAFLYAIAALPGETSDEQKSPE